MTTKPLAAWAAALCLGVTALAAAPAWAKLPPPSEEAKAKAAEAAAKAAWSGKVDAYALCKSMDSVAARYYADVKKAGKDVKPPVATPPCADPGPFVYTPAVAAPAAVPATAAPAGAAPAVAAAPAKK
jgi:hypothetical protein